ncbi:hypothetical protein KV708_19150 [Comamonas thiooxydans]|uniref:host specificity factor TipJ family phage tail protein n=1 Tax=Comamonas thiooxydans TaxID=363952 RepID=UPI00070D8BD6|nr:host specificity factor TipJ family phage tail protein [Comamonas thiooxydans]
MTIKIYPGQMPSQPVESHPWAGTIAGWFAAVGIDYAAREIQPITLHLNGVLLPVDAWAETVISNEDQVDLRPIPHGGVFKLVGSIFNFFFGWLLPSTSNQRYDTPQGKQLSSAEGKANTAKLNGVVPELLGQFIRYPDYLTPPRRYFSTPREQWLEMLLCVGPGQYQIDPATVKIGNTPLSTLEGAEFTVHGPGADLGGITQHENWYSCPEVGGTSAGTAGLELSAIDSGNVNPTAGSYALNGAQITADVDWPNAWGSGTAMSLMFEQDVTVATVLLTGEEGGSYNTFTADWREIAPSLWMLLTASGALTGSLRVESVAGNMVTLAEPVSDGDGGFTYRLISGLPDGVISLAVCRAGRTYTAASVAGKVLTLAPSEGGSWAGFAPRTVPAAKASFTVQADTVYGEQAGPFVSCPAAEVSSTLEVDIFFSQGLCYVSDKGEVQGRSVGVEIQYRDYAAGGAWQSVVRWYTDATMDQIGFTERIALPYAMRPQVRVRRRGAKSTSTQVHDEVQWYAMRTRLPTRTSYPDWTTLSVRVRGLGQIAARSENQLNLVATRMLPVLQGDGSWSAPQPTRDISAALRHICSTVGYGLDSIDMAELQRLHGIWTARGETADHVFDETTVLAALQAVLAAGMSELTIDDGLLRSVRAGVRTVEDGHAYSAQNTTEGIARSFSGIRPDDNDGVEVEFSDASDNWNTKTVNCVLPGSLGIKLEKLKVLGVTDRTRAWRIGMRRARQLRYERWTYSFTTELDALNNSYGDFVSLVDDIPGFGQSALLTGISIASGQARLEVTEPLRWESADPYVVAFRRPDGTLAGPWPAAQGASAYEVLAPIPVEEWPQIKLPEPPHVYFGPVTRWSFPAIVKKVSPSGTDGASVQCVNYDARLFDDDNNSPPPP